MTTRFVLATANRDKAREMASILAAEELDIELVERPDEAPEVVEDAETLEGNARLKATALCEYTGLPAIADDTGLEVAALGGAPGVRSARFAGPDATYEDNRTRLLECLRSRPLEERGARFVTVAVAHWPDGADVAAIGTVDGVITDAPRGERGFGYDPVFVPMDGDGRTFAEMTSEEKHARSHRGEAIRKLARALHEIVDARGG